MKKEERVHWRKYLDNEVFLRDLDDGEAKYNTDRKDLLQRIAAGKYHITPSDSTTLILDLDSEVPIPKDVDPILWRESVFEDVRVRLRTLVQDGYMVETAVARPSFREGCWHVIVNIPACGKIAQERMLDAWSRSALQIYLGSDPVKERLSWVRISQGDDEPSILIDDDYAIENQIQIFPAEYKFTPDPAKVDPALVQYKVGKPSGEK